MQPIIVMQLPTLTQAIVWPRHAEGYCLIQVGNQVYRVYPLEDGHQANFCYRI